MTHTIRVPCSRTSVNRGPGPSTCQPMSPGPQLLEYMSIRFFLWLSALASDWSVDLVRSSNIRTPAK